MLLDSGAVAVYLRGVDHLLAAVPESSPPAGECIDDGVLLAYRAGKVSGDAVGAIDRHLAACSECRALLAELAVPVPETVLSWAEAQMPSRRRWLVPLGAGVAAAAAIAAVTLFTDVLPRDDDGVQAGLLAGYAIEGPRGVERLRGSDPVAADSVPRFVADSPIEIVLRPAQALPAGSIPLVALYTSVSGGKLEIVRAGSLDASAGGSFRFIGRADDVFGYSFGVRELHVVFGLAGTHVLDLHGLTLDEAKRRNDGARFRSLTSVVRYERDLAPDSDP